jgi:hypothetical protein
VAFTGTTNNLLAPAPVKFHLGAGTDNFILATSLYATPASQPALSGDLANLHIRSNTTLSAPPEIIGFQKGVDHVVLDALIHSVTTNIQVYADGKPTLAAALGEVSAKVAANTGAVFTYGGDTYVYSQDGRAGVNMAQHALNGGPPLATGDGLIKLTGVIGLTVGTGAGAFDVHYG